MRFIIRGDRMKKFLAIFLILILLCACTPQPNDLTEGYTQRISHLAGTPQEKFIYSQHEFAVEILKQNFENKNILISPLSIKLALALVLNGAESETKKQIEKALGLTSDELNKELYKYVSNLSSEELHIANSIWIKDAKDFTVKEDFLQTNADYYNAGVFKEPFDKNTVKKINFWVKENTDKMIDGVIDEIDPLTIMYLINALAFEAEWSDPYMNNDVADGTFTSISGEKQDAKMMCSTEYSYLEDENVTGFMKKYVYSKYAFVALLPQNDISEYITSLSGENIKNILDNKTSQAVICKLPKFSYEYSKTLNDTFVNMGITDAFDSFKADFSKISHTPLYISRVIHKTYIEVNQKGTKAGAVTAVEMNCGSAMMDKPKEVILDKPFLYMIIDTESNLPIFIGALTDVK